ncbi:PAQR family membrane homeostasis protein TrhA [Paraferrimonas haliotis]|uniref:Hemolysin III family protein n=1 Tax=Paraferrimonas haliotis TaxID=2013866 RepID=A0AA37WXY1_9GAMM|nr:hemolysin III family protein [Paraferrimonas haliotis]GLS84064.1 hemolysin III family protein [Paraferrimonas haliotis]
MASDYSKTEEFANALTHGIGVVFACVGLLLLVQSGLSMSANSAAMASYLVYGISMILLFSASTLYHSFAHTKAKHLLKVLDHCAIFLLIAGTYTPLLVIAITTPLANGLLLTIWSLALTGIAVKIRFVYRFKRLSLALYLIMGWLALVALYQLVRALPSEAIVWLFAGGIAYTLGAFFYVAKKLKFSHAIWHLFVIGGAVCHYLTIYWYVTPLAKQG